jgi:hypothetical protein
MDCAADHVVTVDLADWRARLKAAEDPDPVLAELRLGPVTQGPPVRLDRTDVFRADLSDARDLDLVVQARFTAHDPAVGRDPVAPVAEPVDTVHRHRIAVLAPLGEGRWCVLGALSADRAVLTGVWDDDPVGWTAEGPRTFRFTPLTNPERVAIEVVDPEDRGLRHGSATIETHTFFEVDGDRLVQRLSVERSDAVDSTEEPQRVVRWFTLDPELPRLVRTFERRCPADARDCGPAREVDLRWDGARYAADADWRSELDGAEPERLGWPFPNDADPGRDDPPPGVPAGFVHLQSIPFHDGGRLLRTYLGRLDDTRWEVLPVVYDSQTGESRLLPGLVTEVGANHGATWSRWR